MNKLVWFLTIILGIGFLAVCGSVSYYYLKIKPINDTKQIGLQKQQINDVDLQMKCSEIAAKSFKEDHPTATLDSYTNHWNKSLNKCFVETTRFSFGTIDLYDAIENQEYASFSSDKFGVSCFLFPGGANSNNETNQCNTRSDFDNFVNPYMNN